MSPGPYYMSGGSSSGGVFLNNLQLSPEGSWEYVLSELPLGFTSSLAFLGCFWNFNTKKSYRFALTTLWERVNHKCTCSVNKVIYEPQVSIQHMGSFTEWVCPYFASLTEISRLAPGDFEDGKVNTKIQFPTRFIMTMDAAIHGLMRNMQVWQLHTRTRSLNYNLLMYDIFCMSVHKLFPLDKKIHTS